MFTVAGAQTTVEMSVLEIGLTTKAALLNGVKVVSSVLTLSG